MDEFQADKIASIHASFYILGQITPEKISIDRFRLRRGAINSLISGVQWDGCNSGMYSMGPLVPVTSHMSGNLSLCWYNHLVL